MSEQSNSSIIAGFQFVSYKVDSIEFHITNNLGVLRCKDSIEAEQLGFSIAIKEPQRYRKEGVTTFYIGGLVADVQLFAKNKPEIEMASGSFSITGFFEKHGEIPSDQEEYMVKATIPSILLGYLRSTITGTIANAGFGSVVLPLININNMVKDMDIHIVDHVL